MIPFLVVGGGVVALGVAAWLYIRGPGPRCQSCRVAVIGDSISAGNGYVQLLRQALPQHQFDVYGGVGLGTASLLSALRGALANRYDEVIIEGGVNDVGRAEASRYILGNLEAMVSAARSAGARPVVLTLPPWSHASDLIESINWSLKVRGPLLWGARVVDIWTPLADDRGYLRSDYIGDVMGVHPNSAGHQAIARVILDKAY